MLTLLGVAALTFMMLMYALERRHKGFILAFCPRMHPHNPDGYPGYFYWLRNQGIRFADATTEQPESGSNSAMRLEGVEPPTRGLEGRRSSAELQAPELQGSPLPISGPSVS